MRQKLAILLISVALFSSLKFTKQELSLKLPPPGGDEISSYEKRFSRLKDIIPPGAVAGYVADMPNKDVVSDARALARYFVAQYALAPVIVENTIDRSIVIGDFYGDPSVLNKDAISELMPLMDFGDGVFLFARKER
jgi:hypothetical protein